MGEDNLRKINKKLDILISLILEKRQREHNLSDEDQALYLSSFDLAPSEMASLLVKTPNATRILLSRLRKKNKL